MAVKATQRLRELLNNTGGAKVVAEVVVDQVYARDQHENLTYKHPVGRAKFLEMPMIENSPRMLQRFAARLLQTSDAADLWHTELGVKTAEHASRNAPLMFGDLRESMEVTTTVGGSIVGHVPPLQHRLTGPELRAKDEMRGEHGWDLDL
jgi:hypothetical protein